MEDHSMSKTKKKHRSTIVGRVSRSESKERLNTLFNTLVHELSERREHDYSVYQTAACYRLIDRCRKKADMGDQSLHDIALNSFRDLNLLLSQKPEGAIIGSLPAELVENAKFFIERSLENFTTSQTGAVQCSFDWSLFVRGWRMGPGAAAGLASTETHFVEKMLQPWTVTEKCYSLARMLRSFTPVLAGIDAKNQNSGLRLVKGSVMGTVRKNQDTDRTICKEPTGNMACQLSLGEYVVGALRYIGLPIERKFVPFIGRRADLRGTRPNVQSYAYQDISHGLMQDQANVNKLLAFLGSLTGHLATIDLKNASDMITPELVRLLWPPIWSKMIEATRSPFTKINGEDVELHMVSTMGNGFTFPVMTMTLTALIYGYYAMNDIGKVNRIDWSCHGVFGDDIICPSEHFNGICNVLHQAGLIVNLDKSYADGPFRESCGGDYFKGYDVTPFYVKSLSRDSEVYSAINMLTKWCSKHEIPLVTTLKLLVSYLKEGCNLVPEWEDPSSGILTAGCSRHFKVIRPKPKRKRLASTNPLALWLAVGGYVNPLVSSDLMQSFEDKHFKSLTRFAPDENWMLYTPRSKDCEDSVHKCQLPKGWLDGRDASKVSQAESRYVERLISAVL
nr:MAG: RNA-dependent RNA polymerase [Hangzhou atkins-like virus 1]